VRRLLQLFKFLIALLVVVGAVYWFVLKPVPVRTHVIEQGAITVAVMGTGTLEARIKATISPKISGRLTAVHVDQGDRVTKGQLLAVLDDVDLRQQVEVAQSEISAAHASLDLVIADRRRTEVILEQARRDYQRSQNLTSAQVSTSEPKNGSCSAYLVSPSGNNPVFRRLHTASY
jgi:HlyD family secretion protein